MSFDSGGGHRPPLQFWRTSSRYLLAFEGARFRFGETRAVAEMLREGVVRTRDDPVMAAGKLHGGFDFVEFAIEDADGLAGHFVFGNADFDKLNAGTLQCTLGRTNVRRDR